MRGGVISSGWPGSSSRPEDGVSARGRGVVFRDGGLDDDWVVLGNREKPPWGPAFEVGMACPFGWAGLCQTDELVVLLLLGHL